MKIQASQHDQLPLFGDHIAPRPSYPMLPGFKARGASADASRRIAGAVERLRDRIVSELLIIGAATADEMAERLNEKPLMIRPRFSELHSSGQITSTGKRRRNPNGMSATVWRVTRLPMVGDSPAVGGQADSEAQQSADRGEL
jgi:hypothetical protein